MLQFRVECLLGPWSICVWILSVHNPAYCDYCAAPRPWCGLVSRGPISRNVQHLPPPLQRTGEVSCDAPTSSSRVTVWSFNFGKCQMLFLKYGLDVNIILAGIDVPKIKPKRKPRCIRSMKRKRNFIELWRLRSMLTDLLFSLVFIFLGYRHISRGSAVQSPHRWGARSCSRGCLWWPGGSRGAAAGTATGSRRSARRRRGEQPAHQPCYVTINSTAMLQQY